MSVLLLTPEGSAAVAQLIAHIREQTGYKLEEGVTATIMEFAYQMEYSDNSSEVWKFIIERRKEE